MLGDNEASTIVKVEDLRTAATRPSTFELPLVATLLLALMWHLCRPDEAW